MIKPIRKATYGDDTRPPESQTTPPAPQPVATFTQEQVNAMIAAATKTIHDDHAKIVADLQRTISTKVAEFEELQSRFDALAASVTKEEGGAVVNVEELMAKYAEKGRALIESQYASQIAEMRNTIEQMQAERAKVATQELRSRLIAENGGEGVMVVELVQGEDEATILASIAKAKAVFARIAPSTGQPPAQPPLPALPTPLPPAAPRQGGTPNAGQPTGIPKVKGLTRQQYAAQRAELLRAAATRAQSGGNPVVQG